MKQMPLTPSPNFLKFKQFHRDNPHVYDLFDRFTRELIDAGFRRYGAKAVMERIRWHVTTRTKGEFKISNNHTAYYARLWSITNPEHARFFFFKEADGDWAPWGESFQLEEARA